MTSVSLAGSYFEKAAKRLKVLDLLMQEEAYSDVVREAQEVVELALKGMLRFVGIEPPKYHDVGDILIEHQDRFPQGVGETLARLAEISKTLRKDREPAFNGDIDFIPTEEYGPEEGREALNGARFVVDVARRLAGS